MAPQNQTLPLILLLAAASAFALYAFNRGLRRSKLPRRTRFLILGGTLLAILLALYLAELFPGPA